MYYSKARLGDIIITIIISRQTLFGNALSDGTNCRIGPGGIDIPVLLLFFTTLSLITILSPHKKISKLLGMKVEYFTLVSCVIIFMIPLLGIPPLHSIDRGISLIIAFGMIALGLSTGKTWGSLLLCIPLKDEKPLLRHVCSSFLRSDIRFSI
jgi:predicted neutral ceramidase superfamily lipid hydrolase